MKHRAVEECQLTPPSIVTGNRYKGGPFTAGGKGTTCAATDQRGQPRKNPGTLGAVEAD